MFILASLCIYNIGSGESPKPICDIHKTKTWNFPMNQGLCHRVKTLVIMEDQTEPVFQYF